MSTPPRWLGPGLFLMLSLSAFGQQQVTVTKCQQCSNNTAKYLQACQTAKGANISGCQKTYQKRMMRCNKKWCSPKTTKVKVNTGSY